MTREERLDALLDGIEAMLDRTDWRAFVDGGGVDNLAAVAVTLDDQPRLQRAYRLLSAVEARADEGPAPATPWE